MQFNPLTYLLITISSWINLHKLRDQVALTCTSPETKLTFKVEGPNLTFKIS